MLKNDEGGKRRSPRRITIKERKKRKSKDFMSRAKRAAIEFGYEVSSTESSLEISTDYIHAKSFELNAEFELGYVAVRDWIYYKTKRGKIQEGWNPKCFMSIRDEESLIDFCNVLKACLNSRAMRD